MVSRMMIVSTMTLAAASSTSALAGGLFVNLGASATPQAVTNGAAVVAGDTPSQYFYWTPGGGMVMVGGTVPGNGVGGKASIADDGSKFCGTAMNSASGFNEASIYDISRGTWTHLGGIGSSSGTETSSGWGMSADGSTVVGLGWISAGGAHAIKSVNAGAPVDMGSTVPNRSTRANACNADGSIVVGWQDSSTGFRQAAVWDASNAQTLVYFDAAQTQRASEASDVSADGEWVVGNGSSSNGWQAWRWNRTTGSATGAQSLGPAPAPGQASWRGLATAISADGSVIVGVYRPFPGPATFGRGFIWTEADGMQDLTNYVAAQGINTQGLILALPLDISPDGRSIVGWTNGANGFIVSIDPPVDCPEDVNSDNQVNVADLLAVISAWGATGANPADVTGDEIVNVADLLAVISAWGACP